MNPLPESAVARWRNLNQVRVPDVVDVACPFCGRSVSFAVSWQAPKVDFLICGRGRCPRCHETPTLIIVGISDTSDGRQGQVFIYPPTGSRTPVEGIEGTTGISEGIKRAYTSAVNVYNQGEWAATAGQCRRVLEGLTKSMLPADKQSLPLAKQIAALTDHVALAQPVLTLAHALREGGNLGAHFDLEREPDQEVAGMMVELLDDLLEYLFVLPQRITALNARVSTNQP